MRAPSRKNGIRRLCATLLLLAACSDTGEDSKHPHAAPEVRGVTAAYDYRLNLPPKFVRDPDAQGIDSKAELWRGPGVEIGTDFGMYGAAPTCRVGQENCTVTNQTVDGRPALLGRYRYHPSEQRAPFFIHLHMPVREQPNELKLNLFVHCEREALCDEVLAYFLKVRIVRKAGD